MTGDGARDVRGLPGEQPAQDEERCVDRLSKPLRSRPSSILLGRAEAIAAPDPAARLGFTALECRCSLG